MKIRFIINPISGTGKHKYIEKKIKNNLQFTYDIFYTEKQGDATKLSYKAIKENIDVIVAVGGDGTVNECAKALIGSKVGIGVIPCGSGNGFANHIGMSSTITKAIIQLNTSKFSLIDSCSVNGETFVNVSGIGFDAHIANLFGKNKKRGLSNYMRIIIKELFYSPQFYTIEYNNIKKKIKAYLIAFANASQYGNNYTISPTAKIDDQLIDFVIVKEFPLCKIPSLLLRLITGRLYLSKYVEIIKSEKMVINTNVKLIHLDGEPKKFESPITIKSNPKSLKIFSPYEKR
tara:strand:+ start:19885 stop:20751 length:867 start_codon:yes stop_codon:yes gene_type:complete